MLQLEDLAELLTQDVVHVATNFGYVSNIIEDFVLRGGNLNAQAGVAVLDLRNLANSKEPELYLYITGDSDYSTKVARGFPFGDLTSIPLQELPMKLEALIPRNRKVVFVCQGILGVELEILKHLGVNVVTSVRGMVSLIFTHVIIEKQC